MKAILIREFGDENVLKVEETTLPKLHPTHVLVRIKAAGVNPVDTYIRAGAHAVKPKLPYSPGKDGAGVVEAVGEHVTKFKVGDRVFVAGTITGTYAEFAICDESHLIELPENVSFEEGAGVFIPYATAFRALFQKAHVKSGERILVHGASGSVGIALIQLAVHAGIDVVGTAGTDAGLQAIMQQGAHAAFNHTDAAYVEKLKESGEFDAVFEMLANKNLIQDFEFLRMFGRVVVIGNRGSIDFNPRLAMTKDASIIGMSLFNAQIPDMHEIYTALHHGLEKGYLKPVIGKKFSLQDAGNAHKEVIAAKASGKIIIVP